VSELAPRAAESWETTWEEGKKDRRETGRQHDADDLAAAAKLLEEEEEEEEDQPDPEPEPAPEPEVSVEEIASFRFGTSHGRSPSPTRFDYDWKVGELVDGASDPLPACP
jgi:hypothetical protein